MTRYFLYFLFLVILTACGESKNRLARKTKIDTTNQSFTHAILTPEVKPEELKLALYEISFEKRRNTFFPEDFIDTTQDTISVLLQSDFDDDISFYLNDSLLLKEHFKTDPTLGVCEQEVTVSYTHLKNKPKKLKVISWTCGEKLEISIMPGYRILYLSHPFNYWKCSFSNYIYFYE